MRISPFLTRKLVLKGKSLDSDPQALAVYNLDREIIGTAIHTRCPRDHLEAVIKHACKKWGVRLPGLTIASLAGGGFGGCDEDGIKLNSRFHGDNMSVLLHELAHWITDRRHEGKKLQDHGPEFAGMYMQLLDRYKLLPADAFKVMAKRLGISINTVEHPA